MEISSIAAAIVGVRNAAEIAKFIKDSGATLGAAETKLKLADLISALADAKMEIANIKDKFSEKDEEIKSLRSQIELRNKMVWEDPYYFVFKEGEKDGPFCQRCFDSDNKLIRLQSTSKRGLWECFQCRMSFYDNAYQTPKMQQPPRDIY